MTSTVSMKQVKNLINYTIDNNLKLQEEGKFPIAISIEAEAGIGKTSIVRQIAQERGMTFVKLNMAQLDEPGDLIGYPMKEFECQVLKRVKKEDGTYAVSVFPKTVWLNEKQLEDSSNANIKYRQTGKTRMGYAKPAWVPEYNENGCLLFLDDYVRASPQLLQACMELILDQSYISWTLPKKTTICLSNNPDNGQYNVSSLDEAQRTKFMNFSVSWDLDAWCQWAEKANVDGRCINFVMSYSGELFGADDEGNRICNPRSFVMFSDMISGVKNWDNSDSLDFISTIAKGCFKDDGGKFASMFRLFLTNKMHLLIQPKDMLLGAWDRVKGILESALYDSNDQYRPDIASILERRFSNFVSAWLESDDKTPIAKVKDRILEFMENEEKGGKRLFSQDLFYHMIKSITSDHKKQTNKLLFEPKIAKMLA